MYNPKYSQITNQNLIFEFIQTYPLGLLISKNNNDIETTLLPFVIEQIEDQIWLTTHIAKANNHWENFGENIMIHFQGPDKYISPTIYENKFNVPTWNYAAVQFHGTVELIDGNISSILNQSVHYFEKRNGTNWTYQLPEKIKTQMESAIIGIKIKVKSMNAKFKLNQNRVDADYNSVLNFLKTSSSEKDHEMMRWMIKSTV